MATRYVWSGATGAGTGADWTNAYTTLAAADAVDVAGDDILVAHDHAETASSSAAVTYSFAGTRAAPTKVACVNRTTGLPATTAVIKTVGAYDMTVTGSPTSAGVHLNGLNLVVGEGAATAALLTLQKALFAENCTFECKQTSGGRISLKWVGEYRWKNCWIKTNSASTYFYAETYAMTVNWNGGGIVSGSTGNILFTGMMSETDINCRNLDLSAFPASGSYLFNIAAETVNCVIRDSKLPTAFAGSLAYSPVPYGSRASLYNCDSGNTNYQLWIEDYAGKIDDELAIYRTDGAKIRNQANAPVGYAWKCTTNSSTNEYAAPLRTDPIVRYFPGTADEKSGWVAGASKTISVDIAHSAAAALTDAQIWIEVSYLGTASLPLGKEVTTHRVAASITPVAVPASSEAWSGTAQTYRQRISATITPQSPGPIEVVVCIATGNGVVVYVDPTLTVA